MEYQKPPMGVMPEQVWKMKRMEELGRAIVRYIDAELEIPQKWTEEYNRIAKELKKHL